MVKFSIIILTTLVLVVVNASDDKVVPVPNYPTPGSNTTEQPTTTSTASTTSKTTTTPLPTKKTTTVIPTTSSTTSKPTTPTSKPTTPTTKPTTPTPPPTTTPTTKPTPKPTPVPPKPVEPQPGTWVANYTNSNVTCIVAEFAAQLEIPYTINNKSAANSSFIGYVNIPANATATGTCDSNTTQKIQLSWNTTVNATNQIVLTFEKKVNSTKFDLASVEVSIFPDNGSFPEINSTKPITLYHNKAEFNVTLKRSYKCYKLQTLNLTAADSQETKGYIHIQHTQLEAFRNATGKVFAEAEDCSPHETPDVVPIAVGCALVALIVIVLVAYLVGRRRNQARGYLSM